MSDDLRSIEEEPHDLAGSDRSIHVHRVVQRSGENGFSDDSSTFRPAKEAVGCVLCVCVLEGAFRHHL